MGDGKLKLKIIWWVVAKPHGVEASYNKYMKEWYGKIIYILLITF